MPDLDGKYVLISASMPPEAHGPDSQGNFEKSLGLLCKELSKRGAIIVYGGNLDKHGFTPVIESRLSELPARADSPRFVHLLDEPSLIGAGYASLFKALVERQKTKSVTSAFIGEEQVGLEAIGNSISLVGHQLDLIVDQQGFSSISGPVDMAGAFSFARESKVAYADACIAIGGKTGELGNPQDRFFGRVPGVAEEAIGMLSAGKPMIALGAYGGCAMAIATALSLIETDEVDEKPRQLGFQEAMDELQELAPQIPVPVRESLSRASGLPVNSQLVDLITSIINEWGDPKPRKEKKYNPKGPPGR